MNAATSGAVGEGAGEEQRTDRLHDDAEQRDVGTRGAHACVLCGTGPGRFESDGSIRKLDAVTVWCLRSLSMSPLSPLVLALFAVGASDVEDAAARYRPLGINAEGMALFARPRDGARVVWIPAGDFRMNAYFPRPTSEPEGEWVHVAAFGIDETEVTNRQFAQFANFVLDASGKEQDEQGRPLVVAVADGQEKVAGRWRPQSGSEELPALGVTGWGALAYARWVGGDLPQLAEWQRAAGGREGRIYPWGDADPDATRANYRRVGPDMPMPVGSYPAGKSAFGLFDMAGNVYERVYAGGGRRGESLPVMIRGGSWASPHPLNLRTFDLCMQPMEVADRTVGFRCVVRRGAGLPIPPDEPLRFAHTWAAALAEARARNVPLLLSLQYDTCGQCDRTKVGLFRDPEFIRGCNERCVLAVGHVSNDGADDPHPENVDGGCTLYPGITCFEHIDLFYDGLKRVDGFSVSPGNFLLDPRTDDASLEPSEWILVGERELPKSGVGTAAYLTKIAEAQAKLGDPKMSHEEWLKSLPPETQVKGGKPDD